MSTEKTGNRYSEICGATNNRGEPCSLPAGWGTPGSGGDRCKFHGGCSDGPNDTSHLEGNDFAEGNPGGSAPDLNDNAAVHHGFSNWRKAYERFDSETREYVDRLIEDMRKRAKQYAPEVDSERRERLLKEKATLSILNRQSNVDLLEGPGRGMVIEETVEHEGETYTHAKANPALEAQSQIYSRQREIAKELKLWPGFRDESDDELTLSELLSE